MTLLSKILEMSDTRSRIYHFGLIDWSVDRNRKFTVQLQSQLDRKRFNFCELGNQCMTWVADSVRLIAVFSGRNQRTDDDEN